MSTKKLKKKLSQVTLEQKESVVEDIANKLPVWEEKNLNKWMWRPPIMTDMTLQKLKLCFAVGMTDQQACYFSQISPSKLYQHQQENPDFLEEKEILKDSISLQARLNIWANIKKWDSADSKWWLTMRDKDFTNKLQLQWWSPLTLSEEDKVIYEKILKNNIGWNEKE